MTFVTGKCTVKLYVPSAGAAARSLKLIWAVDRVNLLELPTVTFTSGASLQLAAAQTSQIVRHGLVAFTHAGGGSQRTTTGEFRPRP